MRTKLFLAVPALLAVGVASAQDYPRVETFAGFTYTRANSASNVPAFSANGGSGQLVANFNKWVGFVMDVGSVHNGNISDVHLDTTMTNYLFGPRISLRYSRVRPYFNVLFGGMHAGTSIGVSGVPVATQPIYLPGAPTVAPNSPVALRAVASQTSFAMTAGGGLDIKINRHVSFRPIGLDYLMTRLQNLRSLQDNNQHNIRYTTGFNFTFGGEGPAPPPPPPPPPTKTCWNGSSVLVDQPCPLRSLDLGLSAGQTELCPGAMVTLRPAATVPENATYQWRIGGQPISQGPTLDFGATGRDPGVYKVALTVSAPEYNDAVAETSITVRPYRAPEGSLQVSPAEIWFGEKASLTASFSPGQCGGKLGPAAFDASEGSVRGSQFDSSELQFDSGSNAVQRKTVTITARVADEKGAGSAQATLLVKKAPVAKRLPDIIFPNGSARVNNCGKRVLLEELRALLENDAAGKVAFVGHVSANEAGKAGLDQQRALNAAAVISAGQGVCYKFAASQILVGEAGAIDNGVDYQSHFCGSTQEAPGSVVKESDNDARYRRVEVWFIPGGGAAPASLKDYKDAASLSVSNLGCPR